MGLSSAQTQLAAKKTLQVARTAERIKLDGRLDESFWASAQIATDFLHQWPTPGKPATQRTEVRLAYTDASLYVSAKCLDTHPDSIFHRLSKRDELENTDAFSITIDAYRDGQNAVMFGVTPDNIQFDSKFSLANANFDNGNPDGEDSNWDAVWNSAAEITPEGWVLELEIPYSALRFPKKAVQEWGVNFSRTIRRRNESDTWNEVKAEINGTLSQMGILQGITDIKAPLRLSATPFVAAYANNVYNLPTPPRSGWAYPYAVGMDVKYGINEAFTLDATVIPDFGQVRTDNFVLNLSPFEVRFNENRAFFTEGTELFNKGGFFYSRRVGSGGAQLLNATKVSGRTKSGLGVGLFNAVENARYETQVVDGEEQRTQLLPLTNKNIIVLDQNLKNNSSVTFLNTNVMRSGTATDANVSSLLWTIKNKAQSYSMTGKAAYSTRQRVGEDQNGFTGSIDVSKTSGNFQWGTNASVESDQYNPNDLGFLYSANSIEHVGWVNYSRYKPWWKLNNFWSSAWYYVAGLYKPARTWTEAAFGVNFGGNTRSFHNFGMNMNANPWGQHDYFEPRPFDFVQYYRVPANMNLNLWYNSDNRKPLVFGLNAGGRVFDEQGRYNRFTYVDLRWRASGKFTIGIGTGTEASMNNVGGLWPGEVNASAVGYETGAKYIMGRRDVIGLDNNINVNYAFTNRMNLALYSRHYWNKAEYKKFYTLDVAGRLAPVAYKGESQSGEMLNDVAANYFNIDLVFTWRFAPGSDLLFVYKNFIGDWKSGNAVRHDYVYNARNLPEFAGSNSLSMKVLYFLDYERISRNDK